MKFIATAIAALALLVCAAPASSATPTNCKFGPCPVKCGYGDLPKCGTKPNWVHGMALAPPSLSDRIDPRVQRQWDWNWRQIRGPIFNMPGAPTPRLEAVPPGTGYAYAFLSEGVVFVTPHAQREALHVPRAFQFLEGHELAHAVLGFSSEGRANRIGNRVLRLLRH